MERREIFFALISPIGVDLEAVSQELTEALKGVSYKVNEIRLTDLLREQGLVKKSHQNEIERYDDYIAAGDELCKNTESDIFALYGISRLYKEYPKRDEETPSEVAHIFRQIKRVKEIETLNQVYGRNVIFIGCYAPKSERVQYLVNKMLRSERRVNRTQLESEAIKIISTDEDEKDKDFGQKVIDCYPHADYILDCTSRSSLKESCDRLIKIFFDHPFVSPSVDEYCSYIANAASYRSLDLSRQVGAAIFGDDCQVISLGCNEVPKAGGGTYWEDHPNDKRDFALGYDSNQRVREDMARDTLNQLNEHKWFKPEIAELAPNDLVSLAFKKDQSGVGPLYGSMMSDVIEYGRMVHAEMNALTDAARFGRSTKGAVLYCTTMPCHMCTKLIIASGVSKVVYLQPYGKSLSEELFSDSIIVDCGHVDEKVSFMTLKGVTPKGFKRAFHKPQKRKNPNGEAKRWDSNNSAPNFLSTFEYYFSLEAKGIEQFGSLMGM